MSLNTIADGYKLANQQATIFLSQFITVNKEQPTAEAVAVIGDKIIAVGSQVQVENYLSANGIDYSLETSLSKHVLTPGFVEAHMHTYSTASLQERIYYVGQVDRTSLDGELIKASVTREELVQRLKDVVADYEAKPADARSPWIDCWGFDPLLIQGGIELDKQLLNEISPNYPMVIFHASLHLLTLNDKALEAAGFSVDDDPHFVFRDENNELTGNVAEHTAIMQILAKGGINVNGTPEEQENFMIKLSRKQVGMGVTSMVDAGAGLPFDTMPLYERVAKRDDMLVRHHPYPLAEQFSVESVQSYRERSTPMFSVNRVKFVMTDGSIQGFTANLPEKTCYYNKKHNGVSQHTTEEIYQKVLPFHKAGFNVSFHCNGDGMTEALLDMFERLQETYPRADARHCLEHNQLVTEEQLARMKKLGVVHNLFAVHIAIWGDVHAEQTVGPARVKAMEPCRSSINHGVRFALHSDDAVTECNPLFNMWAAMNRKCIFSGKTYGEYQKLTAEEALEAITLGAAYVSNEDHTKGSIEPGKYADFAILEQNPLEVPSDAVKDIKVHGTVLGGKINLSSF